MKEVELNLESNNSSFSNETILSYTQNNKEKIKSLVTKVNEYSSRFKKISKNEFIDKTEEFKNRLRNGQNINDILVEALAVSREAIKRVTTLFPYDTQIEAAIAMIKDKVSAQIKNGEGKTLIQVLVSYINLLEATKDEDKTKHKSVHIMTYNDYLAKRDATNNKEIFELLGFSCGFVPSKNCFGEMSDKEINEYKKDHYLCDVVYSTLPTVALDYLHDNIMYEEDDLYIRKPLGFAIIDEADDILINEKENYLKLFSTDYGFSKEYEEKIKEDYELKIETYKWATGFLYGQANIRNKGLSFQEFDQYFKARQIIKDELFKEDYVYCKDTMDVFFSKELRLELQNLFPKTQDYNRFYFALCNAIKARHSFKLGKDYILDINDDKAKVILKNNKNKNEIKEAIEAKEEYIEQYMDLASKRYHIENAKDKIVKAMFTYPDFLSLYECRVSLMTSNSNIEELYKLYGFNTYIVNPRKKNIRIDEEDLLFASKKGKYNAIIKQVKECMLIGQPVLLISPSVNEIKELSSLLNKNYIVHNLLNNISIDKEYEIMKTAGLYGSVTLSVVNCCRGIDIKLGPGVKELGGLYVIGTSKNNNSLTDSMVRGIASHHADPGKSRFYYSLEDDLVKDYYKHNILKYIINHYDNNQAIKNKKVIEVACEAQSINESKNAFNREDESKYNRVFNVQRKKIYKERNEILKSNPHDLIELLYKIINRYSNIVVKEKNKEDISSLLGHLINLDKCYSSNKVEFKERVYNALRSNIDIRFEETQYDKKLNDIKINEYCNLIKKKLLYVLDENWIKYINDLEKLKNSKTIVSYEDPVKSFEYESNRLFNYDLIPKMYNEMITYATMEKLSFGDYHAN